MCDNEAIDAEGRAEANEERSIRLGILERCERCKRGTNPDDLDRDGICWTCNEERKEK